MDSQECQIGQMKTLLRERLLQLCNDLEVGTASQDILMERCENITQMVVQLSQLTEVDQCLSLCSDALVNLRSNHTETRSEYHDDAPPYLCTSNLSVGRPRFDIPCDFLLFMLSSKFTVTQIAGMLNVSQSTVKRRMRQSGVTVSSLYTDINDEELEQEVGKIVQSFPGIGYRSVKGHLFSINIRVTEHRVREALRNTDPEGSLWRRLRLTVTKRRRYSVRAPNALWHIDGYHKLIRWSIVIHGGVDGFSRVPVFMKASNNNRSKTVLKAFEGAVAKWGLPERVRSDKGGENILVADYMLKARGVATRPFITGKSVHNQRIERLWRDVWCGCIMVFHQLFSNMEMNGILDNANETHLLALHYVFIPRIQAHLDQFCEAFMYRPMRTEGNRCPWQLWVQGQIEDTRSPQNISQTNMGLYGVDLTGPVVLETSEDLSPNIVVVPQLTLFDGAAEMLASNVDPHAQSSTYGIDLYEKACTLLNSMNT